MSHIDAHMDKSILTSIRTHTHTALMRGFGSYIYIKTHKHIHADMETYIQAFKIFASHTSTHTDSYVHTYTHG